MSNNLLPSGSLIYLLFCTSRYGWGFKEVFEGDERGKGNEVSCLGQNLCVLCDSRGSAGHLFPGILGEICAHVQEVRLKEKKTK